MNRRYAPALLGVIAAAAITTVMDATGYAAWNGIDYPLYGFGENVGALGVAQTHIFGPEVGWVGLLVNGLIVAILIRITINKRA